MLCYMFTYICYCIGLGNLVKPFIKLGFRKYEEHLTHVLRRSFN